MGKPLSHAECRVSLLVPPGCGGGAGLKPDTSHPTSEVAALDPVRLEDYLPNRLRGGPAVERRGMDMNGIAKAAGWIVAVTLLAGCGGGGSDGGGSATPTTPTAATAGSSVSEKIVSDALDTSFASLESLGSAAPRVRKAAPKATWSITSGESGVHAVATLNEPMPVVSGSGTLTGSLTFDISGSPAGFTADVTVDLVATYNNAVIACDDGNHTVNGALAISGPMDITGSTASASGSWTWTVTSAGLTIDGITYTVDCVHSGTITYPGTAHATMTGTINGQPVNETVTVSVE